jgi:uncharacterized small protein (DUF1192 family)
LAVGHPEADMAIVDDEPVKKPSKVHEIGSDLSLLSVDELRERVEALKAEIERLEVSIRSKQATRTAADTFFRR